MEHQHGRDFLLSTSSWHNKHCNISSREHTWVLGFLASEDWYSNCQHLGVDSNPTGAKSKSTKHDSNSRDYPSMDLKPIVWKFGAFLAEVLFIKSPNFMRWHFPNGSFYRQKKAWVVCFFMRAPRIFLRLWENIFNKSSEPTEAREDLGILGFHVWFFPFLSLHPMVRSLGGKIAVSTAQVLRAAVSGSWRALGFVGIGCQEWCFSGG